MRILIVILCTVSFISCSKGTFDNFTLKEWSKLEAPNRSIDINRKGNNFDNGYGIVEIKNDNNPNILLLEYYLMSPNKDVLKLDFEVTGANELLYFEFYEDNLFILLNQANVVDEVEIYNFDVQSGKIIFQSSGQLPCASDFEFNWKIGNQDCEWANFTDGRIAFARLNDFFKPQLAIYDWKLNKYDVSDTELSVGLSSNYGYIIKGNVFYNLETRAFENNNNTNRVDGLD